MKIKYDRLIFSLDDDELEKFCREWVENKTTYQEVHRYGGANDLGRDVVGFYTDLRHDGEWDNYQCKQYRSRVGIAEGILAIGKVLYWAQQKEFTAPSVFYFVAPKGLAGSLQGLIDKPSDMRANLIAHWDKYCSKKIIKGQVIPLDEELKQFLTGYNYGNIKVVTVDHMLLDPACIKLLVKRYGIDPGKYPAATVPIEIQANETVYVNALLSAYSERDKFKFDTVASVIAHVVYGQDLKMQRIRFFEADAFQKFYRDNTPPEVLDSFRQDINYGIDGVWNRTTVDSFERIVNVMSHAAVITCAGPLAPHAHVAVKQGLCHHFVNEGERKWTA